VRVLTFGLSPVIKLGIRHLRNKKKKCDIDLFLMSTPHLYVSSAAREEGFFPLRSAISFGAQHVLNPLQPSASWLWPPILALVAQALHPNSVFTCESVYRCSFPHDSHLFDLATKKCLSGTYCWAPPLCSLRMGASP